MKIAILSDIHDQLEQLKKALKAINDRNVEADDNAAATIPDITIVFDVIVALS